MNRIYLDSNVYSNLRNSQVEKFKLLRNLLEQYKSNLNFFFTIAHIRDKRNDLSEHKFADFDFIESYTKDNYIAYHPIEKNTTFYLASPRMVFDDEQNNDLNVRSMFDLFGIYKDDDPILSSAKSLMNDFMNLPIYNSIDLEAIPENQKTVLSKVLPSDKPLLTMRDMMTSQIDLHEEMITNHEAYKELRKMVDESFNNGRFTLSNSEVDFNLAFMDSDFKISFFEFVRDSMNKKPEKKIPVYDFYMQSYHCLDLLGISKDKISKKNNYTNLLNDGMHSYFAQYCDFYVSEDKKTLSKSRALYQQFVIQTKTLTVEEFINILPSIGASADDNLTFFAEKLAIDIENCSRTEKLPTDFGHQCYLEINHTYFNFFDVLMEVKENEVYHFLLRQRPKHHLSAPNFRETGTIVDRCMKLFGSDIYLKGYFDFEKESKEMTNDAWEGRYWKLGSMLVSMVNHHALKDLCLILSSFPKKASDQ